MIERRFEWDPAKAAENIRKHRLSFDDVPRVFANRVFVVPDEFEEEERWLAIGLLGMSVVAVVYTERGADLLRIISMRRANPYEAKAFWSQFPQ